MVHPVHTVRVILPLFLSAKGRHRPSLDMSDGIPSMGALRAGRPEIQAVPVDCLCCAQATGELHHQKVDAGTSGCIDPFGSTPTRSPIHLAPRRLLLDDLYTTCWVLHAAQSLTSKSWVPISISSMRMTSGELIDRSHTFRRLHRRSRLDAALKVHASPAR